MIFFLLNALRGDELNFPTDISLSNFNFLIFLKEFTKSFFLKEVKLGKCKNDIYYFLILSF